MGNIYREVVCKKKTRSVILIVLFISFAISVSTFLTGMKSVGRSYKMILNTAFTTLTLIFIMHQILKCMTKYKYSIMVNKFMIHRMYSNNQINLENIYLKDIVYIGKNKKNKFSCKKFRNKLYMCDIFGEVRYCCVYKTENGYNKFYFQPSEELIRRIERLKESDTALDA